MIDGDNSPFESTEELVLLRQALQGITRGVVITTGKESDFQVVYCNQAFETLCGYSKAEILGKNLRFLQHDDRNQRDLRVIRQALEQEHSCSVLLRNYTKNADLFWNSLTITPIFDRSGKACHFVAEQNDVTDQVTSEAELRKTEALLAEAQCVGQLGSWRWDLQTQAFSKSGQLFDVLCVSEQQPLSNIDDFYALVHEADLAQLTFEMKWAIEQKSGFQISFRVLCPDGSLRTLNQRGEVVLDASDQVTHLVGTLQDVSDRAVIEDRLTQAMTVFERSAEGIMVCNVDCQITLVNPAFSQITGYEERDVVGKDPKILSSGQHDEVFYQQLWQELTLKGTWRGEIWNRRKSGEVYPEWLTISTVYNQQGLPTNYIGIFSDISAIKNAQQKLDHLAHHDPLTQLPNRLLFLDRLQRAIARAKREQHQVAVLFLDLDRFKDVNDSLGHVLGDKLLIQIAGRLQQVMRDTDSISRLGGDEFTILLEKIQYPGDAGVVARKVLAAFEEAFQLDERYPRFLSTSIGISLYPDDGETAETLLTNADTAMYRVKEEGRNGYEFYRPEFTHNAIERFNLESEMRLALEREEFVVFYQPQLNIFSGEVIGAEALVRWKHPEKGFISPGKFIPLAEETGLVIPLGEWVLHESCRQWTEWQQKGVCLPRVAVNVAGPQMQRSALDRIVDQTLTATRCLPAALELEITESFIMRRTDGALSLLDRLHEHGISLAIDDFGTGYSSLSRLSRMPINKLKIDQSFISQLNAPGSGSVIAKTIIGMGRGMQMNILAEGVEEEHQLRFLEAEGCEGVQGFLYSRPLPAEEFEAWFAQWHPSKI